MQGLIIKEVYLKRFFEGNKTAEVRSQNTSKRGLIFLCCSKKQEIWGQAELYDVLTVEKKDYLKYEHLHKSTDFLGYEVNYLWCLRNIVSYENPVKYEHKKGCVIWINLPSFSYLVK
jgi:hypothetical protein